jgi:hypothetical protein
MKQLIAILVMAFATAACAKEEPKKPVEKPAVTQKVEEKKVEDKKVEENTNCVKKDKNGKCPPLPNSPKPTPKKVEPK